MSGKDSNTTFGLINYTVELVRRSSDIFFDFINVMLIKTIEKNYIFFLL